ncbi:MAG TPA: SPASM domain-containing protein, partial [Ktedonobacteraceae bacterium]|nr:SPASM domain-containing protein [Ktedonobacteraceae bacterium]
ATPVFPDESTTLSAWLHISNACNLACSYCYVDKTTGHMQDDTAYRSVGAIFRSAVRRKVQYLLLKYAGGEASLLMSRVCSIHDYATKLAQEHGIQLQAFLLSNGVMLPQKTIEALKTRQIGLMISLDGIGDAHDSQRPFANGLGSFRYVERTLKRLRENDLTPHISVTISQRNLASIPELLHYLLDHDLPFSLNYYREHECSSHLRDLRFAEHEMIETMQHVFRIIEERLPKRSLLNALLDKADLENPHQYTCGAGHNYLVIDQRGGIAKCHADIKSTITTIDNDDPLLAIQQDHTGLQNVMVDEKEGCRSCQWRYWCTGGCPLLTWKMTGRSDRKSPNCGIYQALFPAVLRLEALRLLAYTAPLSFQLAETDRAVGATESSVLSKINRQNERL